MLTPLGSYDTTLQMFVVTSRGFDPSHLLFLRWLADRRRLEHLVAGPACGVLVEEVFTSSERTS